MIRRVAVALAVALLALAALWLTLRKPAVTEVALPVINRSAQAVQLLFYGDGLSEHVLVQRLPPQTSLVIALRLSAAGAIRLKAESERVRVDTVLADSNTQLRTRPLQFEVLEGNRFVLVPR